MNRLMRLREAGVSIWLDTLSRELLQTGEFEQLMRDFEPDDLRQGDHGL